MKLTVTRYLGYIRLHQVTKRRSQPFWYEV